MAEYADVDEAIGMTGLRVVLPPGIPSPWSEAVKGFLHVKKIPFIRVRHNLADCAPLRRWTAQSSVPVMIHNDERPRGVWSDQLFLAERLQPDPPLVPSNMDDRVMMFGFSNELCGENGFGWSRRLMAFHAVLADPGAAEDVKRLMGVLGAKYGYSAKAAGEAPATAARIAGMLAARLDAQHSRGSRFFIGGQLSALDIYWAAFAALLDPLPEKLCPMIPDFRRLYICDDPVVRAAMTPRLLAHRDFIYQEYLELPLDL